MNGYKAFLFDWDGTLSRTLESWLEIIRECFESQGIQNLTDTEIFGTLGRIEAAAKELGLTKSKITALTQMMKREGKKRIIHSTWYDGVEEVLEHLKNEGKKTGIITSNFREVIDGELELKGKTNHFDIIVTGDEVMTQKPDPEGILHAIDKFGIRKDEVIMLGDTKHDIGAANNAGIDSVLYFPGSHELFYDFDEIKKLNPTYIIDDWSRLLSV